MQSNPFIASLLRASVDGFAGLAASHLLEDGLEANSTPTDFQAWKQHFRTQLLELGVALEDGAPQRFAAHVAWSRDAFAARALSTDALRAGLDHLQSVLLDALPEEARDALPAYFESAAEVLEGEPDPSPSAAFPQTPPGELADAYLNALRAGDELEATKMIVSKIESGSLGIHEVLEEVLAPVLRRIGRLWHRDEATVSEEHFVSLVTARVLARILGLAPRPNPNGKTVVLTTVAGDAHDIGIQVVSAFFQLDGWRTICLGANTPAEDLARAVRHFDADLVALGGTLSMHREAVVRSVRVLRDTCGELKILVGGLAFGEETGTWRRVGADACASTARAAVETGRKLVGLQPG